MANRETLEQAGMTYVRAGSHGSHILKSKEGGEPEEWFHNPGHASYGITHTLPDGKKLDLEFARSLKESDEGSFNPEDMDSLDEVKDNPTSRENLLSYTGADTVGKDKSGNHVFRHGYFYSGGRDSSSVAAKVVDNLKTNLPNHDIKLVDNENVWKPFKGGASVANQSHFKSTVKITPKVNESDEGSFNPKVHGQYKAAPSHEVMTPGEVQRRAETYINQYGKHGYKIENVSKNADGSFSFTTTKSGKVVHHTFHKTGGRSQSVGGEVSDKDELANDVPVAQEPKGKPADFSALYKAMGMNMTPPKVAPVPTSQKEKAEKEAKRTGKPVRIGNVSIRRMSDVDESVIESPLEEMAVGIDKTPDGKKIEWNQIGTKHMVTIDGEPAHHGFVDRTLASSIYQKLRTGRQNTTQKESQESVTEGLVRKVVDKLDIASPGTPYKKIAKDIVKDTVAEPKKTAKEAWGLVKKAASAIRSPLKTANAKYESVELDESKKKIGEYSNGLNTAKVYKMTGEHDEGDPYVVHLHKNGKHYEPADYFTNDVEDAHGTAKSMVK